LQVQMKLFGVLRRECAGMGELGSQRFRPACFSGGDLQAVAIHRGGVGAGGMAFQPSGARQHAGQEIGVEGKRGVDGFAFGVAIAKAAQHDAQRVQHHDLVRGHGPRFSQKRTRFGEVVALHRMDAKAEQCARMLRVGPSNIRP
jgi:hypothetical protein